VPKKEHEEDSTSAHEGLGSTCSTANQQASQFTIRITKWICNSLEFL